MSFIQLLNLKNFRIKGQSFWFPHCCPLRWLADVCHSSDKTPLQHSIHLLHGELSSCTGDRWQVIDMTLVINNALTWVYATNCHQYLLVFPLLTSLMYMLLWGNGWHAVFTYILISMLATASDVQRVACVIYFVFYSGICLPYFMELVSLKLIGAVGARNYARSSFL